MKLIWVNSIEITLSQIKHVLFNLKRYNFVSQLNELLNECHHFHVMLSTDISASCASVEKCGHISWNLLSWVQFAINSKKELWTSRWQNSICSVSLFGRWFYWKPSNVMLRQEIEFDSGLYQFYSSPFLLLISFFNYLFYLCAYLSFCVCQAA